MTFSPTGRALRIAVSDTVRETMRRSLRDLGWGDQRLAGLLGLSKSRVEAWWTDAANAPAFLVAHPDLPGSVVARLVGDLLALRPSGERAAVSAEKATALFIGLASKAISEAAAALADGRIDASERETLGRAIAALRDRCDAWLRDNRPLRTVGT